MSRRYGLSMFARRSAQQREADALAYLREHGFHSRALDLAGGDPDRVRETVGYVVLNALRYGGLRAAELLALVDVHSTTAWRHPWLEDGRRLRRAVDLAQQVERLGDLDLFNRAAEVAGLSLRLVRAEEGQR